MNMLGKNILVISSDKEYEAVALDINKKGKLIVELPDKSTRVLSSEDISIKLT